MVRGTQSYNDSITTAFRDKAVEILQKSPPISLAYIDQDKQPQFLSSFQRIKESERKCESGQDARDVSFVCSVPAFTCTIGTLAKEKGRCKPKLCLVQWLLWFQ